jgi:DNA-binding NarL/FixJ family response regulator
MPPGNEAQFSLSQSGESSMPSLRILEPIQIGLFSDEPIRLEGLTCIFEQPCSPGGAQLIPVVGTLEHLLSRPSVEYLVYDLQSTSLSMQTLTTLRRARPSLKLIVIGPEGDDELVMQAIMSGARAWLDLTAGPEAVRMAIEVVTGGSIWAPRRLLSKLIDRLLKVPDHVASRSSPHLTEREKQVLDQILQARSNREIAHQLGIEERTVKAHVGRLMRKTGADNRIELSMCALHRPLVPHTRPRGQQRMPTASGYTNR